MSSIAVVGLGAAGKRYASLVRAKWPDLTVIAVRLKTREHDPRFSDVTVHSRCELAPLDLAAAVVSGPASSRVDWAEWLSARGVPTLLEKPVGTSTEDVERLEALENPSQIVVGYNMRHHGMWKVLLEHLSQGAVGQILQVEAVVGQALGSWRPTVDPRDTVSAQRSLGGGALLELSHEVDLVRTLMGDINEVWAQTSRLGDEVHDVEDSATIALRDSSGVVARIGLDMVRTIPRRTLEVVGTRGTVTLDFLQGLGVVETMETKIEFSAPDVTSDTYRRVLDDLADVMTGSAPRIGLSDGLATLRLVNAARASADQRKAMAPEPSPVDRRIR